MYWPSNLLSRMLNLFKELAEESASSDSRTRGGPQSLKKRCLEFGRRLNRLFAHDSPGEKEDITWVESFLETRLDPTLRKVPFHEITKGNSVGSGGMGITSDYHWTYMYKPVAVKSTVLNDMSSVERFATELNLAHRCAAHPSFPGIIGWMSGERHKKDDDVVGMMLMENFDFTLATYLGLIREERLPRPSWRQRISLMLDYAAGLEFLHDAHRCLHGNMHPGSLVTRMRTKSIADGLLINLGHSMSMDDKNWDFNLSSWTAPDMAETGYTVASDVFAFGMIMLSVAELTIKSLNPPDTTLAERDPVLAILVEFQQTRTVNIEIPTSFDAFPGDNLAERFRSLISKCLDPVPMKRPTMKQLCLELRGLLKEIEVGSGMWSDSSFETN